MGLISWKNSRNGKIMESDVIIAMNYLSKDEIEWLELIVVINDYSDDKKAKNGYNMLIFEKN